jgi:hypothetical protein
MIVFFGPEMKANDSKKLKLSPKSELSQLCIQLESNHLTILGSFKLNLKEIILFQLWLKQHERRKPLPDAKKTKTILGLFRRVLFTKALQWCLCFLQWSDGFCPNL